MHPLATESAQAPRCAVQAQGVQMRFGNTVAVRDASFALEEGRFLTILGPSGSGKTTLLQMIAGFLAPTGGSIRIFGRPVGETPPHRRSVGMVFQKLALFPHMTAAQNVAFPLKMRRFDAREIPDRVARYLDLVKLGGLGDRRPHQLSGGQQQRVAIARALVFEPDILLLDEPLAALDAKLREEMQLEFRRIQRELGVTTLNVTHDQREALVMSDQVIVMEGGRILQDADPATAYRAPSDAFVAGFIGLTDFLDGVFDLGPDGPALRVGDARAPGVLAGAAAGAATAGGAARGALRAEKLLLCAGGETPPGADVAFDATLVDTIFEGARCVHELDVPALGRRLRAIGPGDAALTGACGRLSIGWRRQDLMLFAKPSKENDR